MRSIALIVGVLLLIPGLFFAAQGAGIIMWPADSFMLANHGVGALRRTDRGGRRGAHLVVAALIRPVGETGA